MILRGGKSPQVACERPGNPALFAAPHSDQHQSLENFSMPTGDGFRTSPVEVYFRVADSARVMRHETIVRTATRPAPPHTGRYSATERRPISSRFCQASVLASRLSALGRFLGIFGRPFHAEYLIQPGQENPVRSTPPLRVTCEPKHEY